MSHCQDICSSSSSIESQDQGQGDCRPAEKEVPYFYFPSVTSIENSIFLVNCNDACINDQDGCGTLKRQVFDNPVSSFAGSDDKVKASKREIVSDMKPSLSRHTEDIESSSTTKVVLTPQKGIPADISDDLNVAHSSTSTPSNNASKRPSIVLDEDSDQHSTCFKFTIKIDSCKWKKIYSLRATNKSNNEVLPSNWTNVVSNFLIDKIPYCCINFKRHKLYSKGNKFVAKFWFQCGIEGCSLDGKAHLDKYMVLHVANTKTSLKHIKGKKKSFRSRYVRGQNRLKL